VARAARLPLALAAVLAVAACGSEKKVEERTSPCPTRGAKVTFPQLDPATPYVVAVETNLGSFTISLDVDESPCATASFAALVRKGFFDGTSFHRIVPGFVVQGGDPTGKGTGGPGYTVRDRIPGGSIYVKRDVAMAKTATEPPGTSGSQFFIVLADNAGLQPDYALLGSLGRGWDLVQRIGLLGDPATGKPTRKVVVRRMTISP
jgi:peptidyl-prolyl cis-trans isomerase B (cyclophilin B)